MKTIIAGISIGVIMLMCFGDISLAGNCDDAKKMIDWTLANPPDDTSESYFKEAFYLCPNKPIFYYRIAKYYKGHYNNAVNAKKQAAFKERAIAYYTKGIHLSKGDQAAKMTAELDDLQRHRKSIKAEIRALQIVPKGSTGKGTLLNINFALDSYMLTDTAQHDLDDLGKELAGKQSMRISLEGHTDMHGESSYNEDLSVRRAKQAKQYLVTRFRIAPQRIETTGYGFERLVDHNDPFSARNRRVEVLKITE
jgi:outer membrane protein OmpA-like peptidoglycan-associated protein